MYGMGALGITAGAHRLWAHRSYKAKLPLRILLACFNSMAFQVSIFLKFDYITTTTMYYLTCAFHFLFIVLLESQISDVLVI